MTSKRYAIKVLTVAAAAAVAIGMMGEPAFAQRRGGGGNGPRGGNGGPRVAPRAAPRGPVAPRGRVGRVGRPGGRSVVIVRGGYYASPFYGWSGWYGYDPYGYGPYGYGYGYAPFYGGAYDGSASLRIQVSPREAEVFVDGYLAGVVDDFDGVFQRLHVVPGNHEIAIYNPGYRTYRENLYLEPRGGHKIQLALAPLGAGQPDQPRPQPRPEPREARPRGPRGQAPADGRRDPNVAPRPGSVDAAPGLGSFFDRPPVEEISEEAEGFGTVGIKVEPADAVVSIDGEDWYGPGADEELVLQVAEGTHRVQVSRDGYRIFSTDLRIRAGERTPLDITLSPNNR